MKTTWLIQLVLSFVILFLTYSLVNADKDFKNICVKEANLECLQNNFDKLYYENYTLWSKILGNAEIRALACDSTEDTAEFLRLVKLTRGSHATGNAEFEEYFSENIERLCIQKSKCFLDGLLILDEPTRVMLLEMLRTPLFMKGFKIDRVFRKAKTNKKYKEISAVYFLKKK